MIFFGLFSKGMQRNLKFKAGIEMTVDECQRIIDNIFSGYKRIPIWQRTTINKGKDAGVSRTMSGRTRHLVNIHSKDWGQRSYWERCALNTCIQGTAADILKLSMARLLPFLKDNLWLRPLLTIHDELLFEAEEGHEEEACRVVKEAMEAKPFEDFSVPVVSEGAMGKCFGRLEELG